jgi:hypothetical protein
MPVRKCDEAAIDIGAERDQPIIHLGAMSGHVGAHGREIRSQRLELAHGHRGDTSTTAATVEPRGGRWLTRPAPGA